MPYTQEPDRKWKFRLAIVRAISALLLLLITGRHALADGECQLGFERWAKFSKARMRTLPASDDRGACLESEVVRRELLDGLARNRATCESATSSSEQSPQQTITMIEINDGFVRSLGICPKEERPAMGADWTPKSQATVPKPAPPPLAVDASPRPGRLAASPPAPPVSPSIGDASPRPGRVAASPPPPPVRPSIAPARNCLDVEHAKAGHYALVNRRCAGHTVLAVVETRDTAGKTACKAYSVSGTIMVGTDMTAAFNVNHECVLNRGSCTSKHVGDMFPECDW